MIAKEYCISMERALECLDSVYPVSPADTNILINAPELECLRFEKAVLIVGACAANFLPHGGSLKRDTISAYGCAASGLFVTTLNNDRDSANMNPGRHIEVNINSPRHVKEEIKKTIPPYYPKNDYIVVDIGIWRSPVRYRYL